MAVGDPTLRVMATLEHTPGVPEVPVVVRLPFREKVRGGDCPQTFGCPIADLRSGVDAGIFVVGSCSGR